MEMLTTVTNLVIAVALGYSANKVGKNALLWGVFGFLFGFVAIGIFLIRTGYKVWGWIITIVFLAFYILVIILIITIVILGSPYFWY